MNLIIKRRLNQLCKRAEPDRDFTVALKRHLIKKIPSRWHIHILKPVAGVATFAIIFGMTTGVYAYGSNSVLPHHLLYPVRTNIERMERALATDDPNDYADVALKHLEKRVHEIDVMDERSASVYEEDVRRVTTAVQRAMHAADALGDPRPYDVRIRNAEVRSASMLHSMASEHPALAHAISESAKDLGRVVWKMETKRKEVYENVSLRYEAELFGLVWSIEQGKVVVETEDVEQIISNMRSENVQEVIETTGVTDAVTVEPTQTETPAVEKPASAPVVSEPVTTSPTPEPAVKEPAPAPEPEPVSEPTVIQEPVTEQPAMTEEEIIRERLRRYFEKLRLQGKIE